MATPRLRGLGPGIGAIAATLVGSLSGCSANGTEHGGDDPPADLAILAPLASLTAPSDLRVPAEWERGVPGLRWAQRLDTSNIIVRAGGAGDVVLAASLEVPTSIGGRAVQPERERDRDVIVAALTPDGQARWTTVIASSEPDAVEDMAVDARGFVTVTGTYGAPLGIGAEDLEPDRIVPSASAFLARIAPGGEVVSARGPLDLDEPVVAAAPGGVVVASGRERIDVQMADERLKVRWSVRCWREDAWGRPAIVPFRGGAILAGQAGGWDGVECHDARRGSVVGGQRTRTFVTRILEGGRVGWAEGLPERVGFAALAASPAGRIAVGVYGRAAGVGEIQILLMDADGRGLSVAHLAIEDGSSARLAALAVDAAGGVVAAGDFEGRLRVAGSELEALGRDVFVARIAPDGTLSWARRLGDEQDQHAVGVALDGTGGVVVTGMEAIRQSGNHPESDAFVIDLVP